MKDKFLEWEERVFTAPYKWLVKKGIVVMLEVSERIYMTMEDLYESRYEEPYRGNPNFPGDD